jgi:hypothetical protein
MILTKLTHLTRAYEINHIEAGTVDAKAKNVEFSFTALDCGSCPV